jgi:hypothetical protein
MDSPGQIHSQNPPAMERHCNRCPRALDPVDRKKGNGGWFAACFKCREIGYMAFTGTTSGDMALAVPDRPGS